MSGEMRSSLKRPADVVSKTGDARRCERACCNFVGDTSLQIRKFAAHTFRVTPVWLLEAALLLHTLVFATLEVFGHIRTFFV